MYFNVALLKGNIMNTAPRMTGGGTPPPPPPPKPSNK